MLLFTLRGLAGLWCGSEIYFFFKITISYFSFSFSSSSSSSQPKRCSRFLERFQLYSLFVRLRYLQMREAMRRKKEKMDEKGDAF